MQQLGFQRVEKITQVSKYNLLKVLMWVYLPKEKNMRNIDIDYLNVGLYTFSIIHAESQFFSISYLINPPFPSTVLQTLHWLHSSSTFAPGKLFFLSL